MGITSTRPRNLGIDFMRALAMFFVICLHFLVQGELIVHADPGSFKYYFFSLMQSLTNCAVGAYGITTGYLLCTRSFRLARVVQLWLQTAFWSVAISCGFFIFSPESRTISEAVSMFLPILRGRYWFFTAYFVTILVSPVLNLVIRTLSKQQFKLLLAVLFLIFGVIPVCSLGYDVMRISGGNHFSWMIVLYIIGGYIRVHYAEEDIAIRNSRYLLGLLLFALIHLFYIFITQTAGLPGFSVLLMHNSSPIIVGEAVCLFLYCRKIGSHIRPKSLLGKTLRFVTPGIYAVYVIHVHPLVFWNQDIIALLRPWDAWNTGKVFLAMLATALVIFTGCVLLDALRQGLFRILRIDQTMGRVSDTLEKRIRTLLAD